MSRDQKISPTAVPVDLDQLDECNENFADVDKILAAARTINDYNNELLAIEKRLHEIINVNNTRTPPTTIFNRQYTQKNSIINYLQNLSRYLEKFLPQNDILHIFQNVINVIEFYFRKQTQDFLHFGNVYILFGLSLQNYIKLNRPHTFCYDVEFLIVCGLINNHTELQKFNALELAFLSVFNTEFSELINHICRYLAKKNQFDQTPQRNQNLQIFLSLIVIYLNSFFSREKSNQHEMTDAKALQQKPLQVNTEIEGHLINMLICIDRIQLPKTAAKPNLYQIIAISLLTLLKVNSHFDRKDIKFLCIINLIKTEELITIESENGPILYPNETAIAKLDQKEVLFMDLIKWRLPTDDNADAPLQLKYREFFFAFNFKILLKHRQFIAAAKPKNLLTHHQSLPTVNNNARALNFDALAVFSSLNKAVPSLIATAGADTKANTGAAATRSGAVKADNRTAAAGSGAGAKPDTGTAAAASPKSSHTHAVFKPTGGSGQQLQFQAAPVDESSPMDFQNLCG